ncbi:MAG: DUF4270 domain-containing protein [Clostridium sp.]|nr:DUF4270 domain-containing protein [Clostridium sp.]
MIKHKAKIMLAMAIAPCLSIISCNDSSTIGNSIVQDEVAVVVDSTFTVSGKSQLISRIQSRTTNQLLGRISAKGFGSLQSDVVTQFMPSSELVTEGVSVSDIDSLVLYMLVRSGEFVGDSLAPMGLEVYRLNKLLPSPIYSDFDPTGYYDPTPLASTIYNVATQSADTIISAGTEIKVRMPDELGKELFSAYLQDPSAFNTPTAFAEKVFKGLYIKNSFGSGRMVRVSSTLMSMYYKTHGENNDTIINQVGHYFAVTPEIITNNDIKVEVGEDLMKRIDDGEALVMGPAGIETQIRFPAPEIIKSFQSAPTNIKVLNTLTFNVPGEAVDNSGDFPMPIYLLLVLSKDKDNFFANNLLPDNKTSFYATYDSTTGLFSFGDMRAYIQSLIDKGAITEEDYTFSIVPVSATFETNSNSYYYYYGSTSQTLSMLTPYAASPALGKLDLDKAEIRLTYSTQTIDQ